MDYLAAPRYPVVAALPAAASNTGRVMEQGSKLWFSNGTTWLDLTTQAGAAPANMVTTDTAQSITAVKTVTGVNFQVDSGALRAYNWGGVAANGVLILGDASSYIFKTGAQFDFTNAAGAFTATLNSGGTILTSSLVNSSNIVYTNGAQTITGQKTVDRGVSAADALYDWRLLHGGHSLSMYARLGAGSYNASVQADDKALIFDNGAQNTGALFIGPWSSSAWGLRISSGGTHTAYGNLNATGQILSTGSNVQSYSGFKFQAASTAGYEFKYYAPGGGLTSDSLALYRNETGGSNTLILTANDVQVTSSLPVVSNAANAFRAVFGSYGTFFRNDGANAYFLVTASGDQLGTWNSLRPLYYSLTTGTVTMQNGLTLPSGTLSIAATTDITAPNGIKIRSAALANGLDIAASPTLAGGTDPDVYFYNRNNGAVWFGTNNTLRGKMRADGVFDWGGGIITTTLATTSSIGATGSITSSSFVTATGRLFVTDGPNTATPAGRAIGIHYMQGVVGDFGTMFCYDYAGSGYKELRLEAAALRFLRSGSTTLGFYADPNGLYLYDGWFRTFGQNGIYFSDYTGGWYMTDTTYVRAYNGKAVAASNFVMTSDESTKNILGTLEYNGRLTPIKYQRKLDGTYALGFGAGAVRQKYPWAVTEHDDETWGRRVLNLGAMDVCAILSAQLNYLEDKVERLERLAA